MLIEEAITKLKKKADFKRSMYAICCIKENNANLLKDAEEYEQIAGWLEELRDLKGDANEQG